MAVAPLARIAEVSSTATPELGKDPGFAGPMKGTAGEFGQNKTHELVVNASGDVTLK
jgi:hypothetical protein